MARRGASPGKGTQWQTLCAARDALATTCLAGESNPTMSRDAGAHQRGVLAGAGEAPGPLLRWWWQDLNALELVLARLVQVCLKHCLTGARPGQGNDAAGRWAHVTFKLCLVDVGEECGGSPFPCLQQHRQRGTAAYEIARVACGTRTARVEDWPGTRNSPRRQSCVRN